LRDLTLPSRALLKKSGQFDVVYREGRRRRGAGFVLVFRPNQLDTSRLGISIHRKLRGAVRRNRIKRIVREVFRLFREIFPAHCDVVFAVRPEFTLDSPLQVREAVILALNVRRSDMTAGRSEGESTATVEA